MMPIQIYDSFPYTNLKICFVTQGNARRVVWTHVQVMNKINIYFAVHQGLQYM